MVLWKTSQQIRAKKWDGKPRKILRIEHKLDGYRFNFFNNQFFARKGEVDYWEKFLRSKGSAWLESVPPNTVIDGELFLPDRPATDVMTALNAGDDALVFKPFAIPKYYGTPLEGTPQEKFQIQDALLEDWHAPRVIHYKYTSHSYSQLARLAAAHPSKLEGYILKEDVYSGWWKVKPVWTVDLKVVGVLPGTGKHFRRLGALICANARGAIVANVGKGCDDAWRDLTKEQVLGRIVEVEHEGIQALGKLKFSRFIRWREDKKIPD
jgi:ATP-dependent DNA ligase